MNQIAQLERLSIIETMAHQYGMTPKNFEATLRATIFPKTGTPEQFAAFLLVAKRYGLDPFTKEIYAFPSRNGGIQPIVPIDGWLKMINDNPQFDGMDLEEHFDADGRLFAITCRIYRKDRSHPMVKREYLAECTQPTEPWKKWPIRMLGHKATIQAARYAFNLSGIIDPDEAERFMDITPEAQERIKRQTKQEAAERFKASKAAADAVIDSIDPDTGEIIGGADIDSIADKMIEAIMACDLDALPEWQRANAEQLRSLPEVAYRRTQTAVSNRYNELLTPASRETLDSKP